MSIAIASLSTLAVHYSIRLRGNMNYLDPCPLSVGRAKQDFKLLDSLLPSLYLGEFRLEHENFSVNPHALFGRSYGGQYPGSRRVTRQS